MNIIASHKMMVKIISYRFADGNHEGQGFKKTDHQSLRHCFEGGVVQHQILNREIGDHALFSGSPYTFEDVVRSVSDLVSSECRQCDISPAKVWINSTHPTLGEHSDHCMAGRVAARVAQVGIFFHSPFFKSSPSFLGSLIFVVFLQQNSCQFFHVIFF